MSEDTGLVSIVKIVPYVIDYKVSEITVYPREEGKVFPGDPVKIVIDSGIGKLFVIAEFE